MLRPHGSSISWDTLRCRGVGGFANSHAGHQNCLFRGSKIHVGSRGRKAGTELFLNYSYDNSYEWADEPEPEADFHHHPLDFSFCRPGTGGADVAVNLTAAGATTAVSPTSPNVFPPRSLAKAERKAPPWDRLRQAITPQPSLRSIAESSLRLRHDNPTPPPAKVCAPRVRKAPAVGLRRSRRHPPLATQRPPLPTLPEDAEDLPDGPVTFMGEPLASLPDRPPGRRCICCGPDGGRCINMAQPNGVGPHRSGRWCAWCTPTEGDERCGCLCGECEVHDYNTEGELSVPRPQLAPYPHMRSPREEDMIPLPQVAASVSSTPRPTQGVICFQRSRPGAWSPEILVHVDTGSTTFSGLPLAPPSVNGWSSRSVTKSLKDFVAITPSRGS